MYVCSFGCAGSLSLGTGCSLAVVLGLLTEVACLVAERAL